MHTAGTMRPAEGSTRTSSLAAHLPQRNVSLLCRGKAHKAAAVSPPGRLPCVAQCSHALRRRVALPAGPRRASVANGQHKLGVPQCPSLPTDQQLVAAARTPLTSTSPSHLKNCRTAGLRNPEGRLDT